MAEIIVHKASSQASTTPISSAAFCKRLAAATLGTSSSTRCRANLNRMLTTNTSKKPMLAKTNETYQHPVVCCIAGKPLKETIFYAIFKPCWRPGPAGTTGPRGPTGTTGPSGTGTTGPTEATGPSGTGTTGPWALCQIKSATRTQKKLLPPILKS